jgi:hypothetical protein
MVSVQRQARVLLSLLKIAVPSCQRSELEGLHACLVSVQIVTEHAFWNGVVDHTRLGN